jgi:hypothetical protein
MTRTHLKLLLKCKLKQISGKTSDVAFSLLNTRSNGNKLSSSAVSVMLF